MAVTNFTCSASSFLVRCCSMKENHHDQLNSNNSIRMNGSYRSPIKVESLSQTAEAAPTTLVENGLRQNIPTKKQLVDPHRQGLMVEGGVGYRQTVVIRSYEVGPDKTATLESILNLLQAIQIFIITLFLIEFNSYAL
jgi:hypothetical protein